MYIIILYTSTSQALLTEVCNLAEISIEFSVNFFQYFINMNKTYIVFC